MLFFYPLILFTFYSQNDVNPRNSYKKRATKSFFIFSGSFLHLHFKMIICDSLLKITFNDQRIISPFRGKLIVLPGVLVTLHRPKDNLS